MSQQQTSPPQGAAQIQRPPTPPLDNFFFLDEVDIGEQVQIQTRIARTLDSTYEAAVAEAIRRSLSSCPDDSSVQTDSPVGDSSNTSAAVPVASEQRFTSVGETSMDMDPAISSTALQTSSSNNGMAAAKVRSSIIDRPDLNVGVLGNDSDESRNSLPDIDNIDLSNAYNEDSNDDNSEVLRSRKGRFRQQQQQQSERRPSLDRMDGLMSERRPSLDRMSSSTSERRPSLDRMLQNRSERRPSLEMRDKYLSERRPSLERLNGYHALERRPSLEQLDDHNSERSPSLSRMEQRSSLDQRERRPSLEMIELRTSEQRERERRPSLERVDQRERRASLDRMQSAEECLQSISSPDSDTGPAQGINTLRPWPLNDKGIPSNWDPARLPGDGEGLYQLVQLLPIDREYSAVAVDFEEAGMKVISVERLQNTMLLERFNIEKEHLLKLRPPDFELNERYLYHGTQANKHCLCEEGLDHRLSFQGCFGRGIYFSDNPRKCMLYATSFKSHNNKNTHPMILICRVLLGESKVYQHGIKDPALKREPEKPRAKGGWRYYDSVQGIPVDYPEFVVYDNRRSMIEYIVTFEEVTYRAPPSASNFYVSQIPQLYKVEPITLPIPEDELDRMYMLCPDTDSDGSCDEHTREVERLRDNVKQAKAKRLGIPYRPPTKEEKRYERLHWKRVCYYSCPPGSPLFEMMIMKKKQEKEERKKRKAEARAKKAAEEDTTAASGEVLDVVGSSTGTISASVGSASVDSSKPLGRSSKETEDYEVENESVAEVLSILIADFLNITATDNVAKARRYILDNSMDLDKAICQFYRDME